MGHTMRRLVGGLLLLASMSASAAAPALGDKQLVMWERLRAAVSGVEQQLDGVLGVAILDLSTGQQLLVHPDEVFAQASSIKITVLATPKESWLPRNLPEDLRIANKPGALEGVRNDSGIVFLKNRPYVICVMTTYLASERAGEDAITEISAAAFGLFDRLGRASDLGRVLSPSNGSQR